MVAGVGPEEDIIVAVPPVVNADGVTLVRGAPELFVTAIVTVTSLPVVTMSGVTVSEAVKLPIVITLEIVHWE